MKEKIMPRSIFDRGQGLRRKLMLSGATGAVIGALMLSLPTAGHAQVGPPPNPQPGPAPTPFPTPGPTPSIPGGQSFQGNGSFVMGGGSIVQTATQDTITVTSPQAVINWTPNDRADAGTIDFLPTGLSGLFIGAQDFTVLNRIIPLNGQDVPVARLVALNGNIRSQVGQGPGGAVWFYSPGGFLVGANTAINVGSLILTSQDIDTSGGLFGANGDIRFRAPTVGTGGSVEIASGAQIEAFNQTPNNAYVALVSPRVVQAGTVITDGSVALVAAEVADIRINSGLFDINVTVGTGDAHGIIHTGFTGGPSQDSTQPGRTYLVAIPKSQALTMLVSGGIGYSTATSASIDAQGNIILSAGRNVVGGASVGSAVGTGAANISIEDSVFVNNLDARATGTINARPSQSCAPFCSPNAPNGQILFGGDTRLSGDIGVNVSVGQAQQLIVSGALILQSTQPGQGGSVALTIDDAAAPSPSTAGGGLIRVTGGLLLDASAAGDTNINNGAAMGGTARLSITAGTLTAPNILVTALGAGGIAADGTGSTGRGGTVAVNLTRQAVLNSSFIDVAASGRGGERSVTSLNRQDGVDKVAAVATQLLQGGAGFGGTATMLIGNGSTYSGNLTVTADGVGTFGSIMSGNGTGGIAGVTIDNGRFIGNSLFVSAEAYGGSSGFGQQGFASSARGGNATGGRATLVTSGSAQQSSAINIFVSAGAVGGDAALPANFAGTVQGGNAIGGSATMDQSGIDILIGRIAVSAEASGGNARGNQTATGGNATGGTAVFNLRNSATLTEAQQLTVTSNALGGIGVGQSGSGTGGNSAASFDASTTATIPTIRMTATGFGGGAGSNQQSYAPSTNIGGSGQGGLVTFDNFAALSGTTLLLDASAVGADVSPLATTTVPPRGGDATGGTVQLSALNGTMRFNEISAAAYAEAGSGGNATGRSGLASGGTVAVSAFAALTTDLLALSTSASIFDSTGAAVQSAQGGTIGIRASGGNLTVNNALDANSAAVAQGFGAAVSSLGANGGSIVLNAENGGVVDVAFASLIAGASVGSALGPVGTATGGEIRVESLLNGDININSLQMDANAMGGSGPSGGAAVGGLLRLSAQDGALTLGTNSFLNANGRSGLSSGTAPTPESRGGNVTLLTQGETARFNFVNLFAFANGDASDQATAANPLGSAGPVPAVGLGGSTRVAFDGGITVGLILTTEANGYGGSGGDGFGGIARLDGVQGSATIGFTSIAADGFGGESLAGGVGGNGFGGDVEGSFTGGDYDGAQLQFSAHGRGGRGRSGIDVGTNGQMPGSGGEGRGGTARLLVDATASNSADFIVVGARGFGGRGGDYDVVSASGIAFSPGYGGAGFGGVATADLFGGTISTSQLVVSSFARGGDGGQVFVDLGGQVTANAFATLPDAPGGNAIGGSAGIVLRGSSVAGALSVEASASGGEGGTALSGFAGGNGQGGEALLIVDGATAGSLAIDLNAEAFGGRGGRALHGDGGNGGAGTGGRARVQSGDGGSLTVSNSPLQTIGYGGTGGNGRVNALIGQPITGFRGGDGGAGTGGSNEFVSVDASLLIANSSSTVGGTLLTSQGIGGRGGNGADNSSGDPAIATVGGFGGNGGSGGGGQIIVRTAGGSIATADGGTLTLQAAGEAGLAGTGGTGITIVTFDPQTQTFNSTGGNGGDGFSGFTAGGTARVEATDTVTGNGAITLSRLEIISNGDLAGRAELIDRAAGSGIRLGSLLIETLGGESFGGRFDLNLVGSGAYIFSENGQILVDGISQFSLSGGLFVDALGSGSFATGDLAASVSRAITARHGGRPITGTTIQADSIIAQSGWVDFDTGTLIQTAGSFSFTANDMINFDEIISLGSGANGQLATLGDVTGNRLSGGPLLVTGNNITLSTAAAGGLLSIDATGNVALGAASSNDDATVNAAGSISINRLEATGFSSANGSTTAPSFISLRSGSDVLLGALDAPGNILINSASISSRMGEESGASSSIVAGRRITTITTGDARFGSMTARSINLNAGGSLAFGSLNAIDSLTARGALALNGGAASSGEGNIVLTSNGAIDIGSADALDNISVRSSGSSVRLAVVNTGRGNATLEAASDVTLDSGDIGATLLVDAGGDARLGAVSSFGVAAVVAAGSIFIDSLATTGLSGGEGSLDEPSSIFLLAGGNALLGTLNAAGDIDIFAASISSASNSGGAPTSSLTAGGAIRIESTGDVRFGSAVADLLKVNTTGAVLFVNGNFGRSADVAAARGITIDRLITGGLARLTTSPTTPVFPADFDEQRDLSSGTKIVAAAPLAGPGAISLGNGTIGTSLDINAANNVTIGSASSGGAMTIVAGGDVALGTLQSGTALTITSATLSGAGSSLTAGTSFSSTQSGTAQFGSINAVGPVAVAATSATGGSVSTSGSSGTVRITAPSGLTITTINSAAATTLSAANGAIALTNLRSTGTVDAQGRSVTVTSGNGTLDFAALVATAGDARVTQASGPLVVQNGNASGTLALTTLSGNLVGQSLTGNAIDIRSSGTATLTGAITATNALAVRSTGETAINAVATGRTVDITSGNIRIASTARVGTAGTTTAVRLTNGNGASRTFIGGDDSLQGYSLSGAEMQRLFGNDISITAPRASTPGQSIINPTRAPDVIIGAFTLQGGGGATANLGSNGTLRIETPGFAQVTGTARVAGATSGNQFIVSANDALQVILGSGALRIENAAGPAGTLSLQSTDIVVATSDAIGDIAGLTDTNAIDDRLAMNDGVVSDDGALVGGTIDLFAIDNIFIENSGSTDSFDDRRGFSAGAGGLNITLDSSSGRIVIDGRAANDLSTQLTGRDTFNNVRINGILLSSSQPNMIPGIDPNSTINGCAIANPAACVDFVNLFPVQSNPLIEDNEHLLVEADGDPLVSLITLDLRDPAPLPNQPLIDEPVTGSGNDDLWIPGM